MSDQVPEYTNTYHNAATPPAESADPAMLTFWQEADGVLAQAAELARVVASAHQGAATQLIDGEWAQARKYFSLSEKYVAWADYRIPAKGVGIHAYLLQLNQPMRLTQAELEAHPAFKHFGVESERHPPMRGWLAVPIIGTDGRNYGLLQASDRYEGDFTAEDEANMVRLAKLTSQALDAMAMVAFPEYRAQWAPQPPAPQTQPSDT